MSHRLPWLIRVCFNSVQASTGLESDYSKVKAGVYLVLGVVMQELGAQKKHQATLEESDFTARYDIAYRINIDEGWRKITASKARRSEPAKMGKSNNFYSRDGSSSQDVGKSKQLAFAMLIVRIRSKQSAE